MVDLPKPTGERAFWDAHGRRIVDDRDPKYGDRGVKPSEKIQVHDRSRYREGYTPGSDERAYFPPGPAPDRQGKPGLTKTSTPVVTTRAESIMIADPVREYRLVEELHNALQRTARSMGCTAQVVSRQPGGYLAQITRPGDDTATGTAIINQVVRSLEEQIAGIDSRSTIRLVQTQTPASFDGSPHFTVGWVRMHRPFNNE